MSKEVKFISIKNYDDLAQELELAKQIGTTTGFFSYYFNIKLAECDTSEQAFNELNKKYFDIFGVERYANYNSFRRSINHWLKKYVKK